jgi:uncharacterized Zn finger protein
MIKNKHRELYIRCLVCGILFVNDDQLIDKSKAVKVMIKKETFYVTKCKSCIEYDRV